MLLTDARRPARVTADGDFVPLDEQDRTQWNRDAIAEGAALLLRALGAGPAGAYAIQAAIAAIHCEAPSAEETDWPQIAALYAILAKVAPSPMVTLNQIVALAMVDGAPVALARLGELARDPGLSGHRRVRAVRAHLLERAGRTPEAVDEYRAAARAATNLPERRYLLRKAAELASPLQ
jgi:predicted RNA polymerase sigma factor